MMNFIDGGRLCTSRARGGSEDRHLQFHTIRTSARQSRECLAGCDRARQANRAGDKVPGAETSTSEPKGQELVYAARISLDRSQMQIDNNLVKISRGMAVTVEIKTGSRTVISYLLSPILRYKHESLHER